LAWFLILDEIKLENYRVNVQDIGWHCFHKMKIIEGMINKKIILLHSCCKNVSTKNQENARKRFLRICQKNSKN
jgi:hypothetical protein